MHRPFCACAQAHKGINLPAYTLCKLFIIQTLHVPWLNTIDMTYRYLTSMKRGRHGRHWIHIYISFSDQISFERIDGSNWTRRSNYTSSYRCVDKREVCFCELFLWMPILVRLKTINKDNYYFYRNTRLSNLSCSWTRQLMKFAQAHLTAALRVNTRQSCCLTFSENQL